MSQTLVYCQLQKLRIAGFLLHISKIFAWEGNSNRKLSPQMELLKTSPEASENRNVIYIL